MFGVEAEEVVAFDELELRGTHGLARRFVRIAGEDAGEAEDFAGVHDALDERLATSRRRDRELRLSVAEEEQSLRLLPFGVQHRAVGIDVGEGDGVEGLQSLGIELTKEIVISPLTRFAVVADFDSISAHRGLGRTIQYNN